MKRTSGRIPAGKRGRREVEAIDSGTEETVETITEDQAESELLDAFGAIPEGAVTVEVWRKTAGQRDAFCSKFEVTEWEMETVARRHGGGEYLAYFKKVNPKGQRTMAGKRGFYIDPARKPASEPAAVAPAAGGQLGELSEFFKAQAKSAMDQAEMMTAFKMKILSSAMTEGGGSSSGDLIVKLITALTPLITLLMSRKDSGQLTSRDLIEFSRELKGTMGGGTNIKDTLAMLGEARELFGGENAPPWLPAVEKLLTVAERALDQRGAPKQLAPGGSPDAEKEEMIGHPFFKFLAPGIPDLIVQAEANNDPATYARMLLDRVQPEHRGDLAKFINRPEMLEEFVAVFPDAAVFREWFGELVDRLRELLEAPARPRRPAK